MTTETAFTCSVCGDPATDADSTICINCDERFHLRLTQDAEGKDCGDVWINEQFLSLEFACNKCLGRAGSGAEPPVGQGH